MRVGQRVGKGQVVGLCGNSGTSSEPHLHYHLQNTPIVDDGAGIKVFFERAMLAWISTEGNLLNILASDQA